MRQERIEVVDRLGSGDLIENTLEVSPGFEIVGLGGFDEAVEVGAGLGAVNRVSEQPILATDREGTDGILDEIRVERNFAMIEYAHELRPLSVQIREGLPGQALRHNGTERNVEPLA